MAQFALVEESAVAKGVRRVVGVTGPLAAQAIATGQTLQAQMGEIETVNLKKADAVKLSYLMLPLPYHPVC